MKPKGLAKTLLGTSALTAAIAVNFVAPSASAASAAWTGTTDALWATTTNWTASPVPGAGDTATFNSAGNGNTTIDLGGGVSVGSVVFDTASAAAYTIGSGAVGSQTLTLGSTLGNVITMNANVVNNQLFNSNLALSVSSTANNQATYYALTNNSATNTLNIAGGISASTAGVKTLRVTGSGNTNISGAITSGSGNVSLFKTGSGTLTLSGGATWSGAGITDGAGFTTSAVFREGTTILNGGAYNNSGGELVIGGVATHGGAGTNTTLQVENGTTLSNISWLSIGRGNGNGTATSNLTLNGNASVSSTNLSAGFNAGNAGNIPKGTITLNSTSSISVGENMFFAESAGSDFTLNLNGTSTFSQTSAAAGETRVGISDNSIGTINVNGGTARFERDTIFGYAGTSTGRLNLASGTVNVASTSERWLMLGRDNASKGEITVNGGNLNLNTNTDIRFGRNGGASGASFVTLNGGAITGWTGNATGAFSGASVIDMNNSSTQAGFSSTFNLNGGTLTIGQVISNNNSGNAAFNFNGGTLRAAASTAAFIDLGGANQRVNVRNGGAIIDTNNSTVTIGEALRHSNIGGDNAIDGGLTKNGLGTLVLTNAANTYTGDTLVNEGSLETAATGNFGLGNVTVANSLSAILVLGNSNSIADTATLFFGSDSFIILNDGINETVFAATETDSSLSIGPGTYTAAQLNAFFGGDGESTGFSESFTGTLTVVPEPSAALLGGLGVLGLLRRRRKA
jgi:autotransporter-associated beta strand protein